MDLTFKTLRAANVERLPQFKTREGAAAHAQRDGSDWTPAQWFQALVGELGEVAEIMLMRRDSPEEMDSDTFRLCIRNELADVACYLDLLALRVLDQTGPANWKDSPAEMLLVVMAETGKFADDRKKFDRGEFTDDGAQRAHQQRSLRRLTLAIQGLAKIKQVYESQMQWRSALQCHVTIAAHQSGVDLGGAIVRKFNAVSERVGADVFIADGS